MILKLNDCLLEKIKKKTLSDDEIESINSIATSRRRGYHFVIGSRTIFDELSKSDYLSTQTKGCYKKIYHEQTQWSVFLSHFSFIIVLKAHQENIEIESFDNKKHLNISLSSFLTYSLDNKANIITEHSRDAEFYEELTKSYLKSKNISGVSLNYTPILGGGDTCHDVIKTNYERKSGVSFCILDSDKKSPFSDIGNTAKKVTEAITNWTFINYYMTTTREIENLIPFELIDRVFQNNKAKKETIKKYKKIKETEVRESNPIKYIDFKKGVKLSEALLSECNNTKNYWLEVFEKAELNSQCTTHPQCSAAKCCRCLLLDGFGPDLLKSCLHEVKRNGLDFDKIDIHTQDEWTFICKNILSYAISPKKIIS